jgi:hypothetical protein
MIELSVWEIGVGALFFLAVGMAIGVLIMDGWKEGRRKGPEAEVAIGKLGEKPRSDLLGGKGRGSIYS